MDGVEAGGTDRAEGRWVELVAAVLLGVAGVLTAWAAYNAALTDGDALKGYTESTTSTTDANFFYNQATQQYASDSATFLQYQLEVERGNSDLAGLVRANLFSPELLLAVEAWELLGDESPSSPLATDAYALETAAEGDRLTELARQQFEDAKTADDAGDRFELAAVFLAVALFLAGVASLFRVHGIRIALLATAALIIVPGIVAIFQGHGAT